MSFRGRSAVAAALLGGLVAACSDSPSEPGSSLSLVVTGTTSAPQRLANSDGVQVVQCNVDLTAVANGKSTATAQWAASAVRFYVGADRGTPVDSIALTAEDMQDVWNASSITEGQPMSTQLVLQAAVPFAFTLVMRYTPSGSSTPRTATYDGSCGAGATGQAAPAVTHVTVTPAGGETQSGALLTVEYDFTAPAGVWETSVLVGSGAVTEAGQFETGGTHSVVVPVPPGGALGAPVPVTVRITDGMLRQAQSTPVNGPVLADHVPPELMGASTRGTFTFTAADLVGTWAPGDTITLRASASDNHALAWVVWELGAPANARDSVPANPVVGSPTTTKIVVRPGWVGTPRLAVWVTDRAGNRSPVLQSLPDSIRIVAATAGAVHAGRAPGPAADPLPAAMVPGTSDRAAAAKHADGLHARVFVARPR